MNGPVDILGQTPALQIYTQICSIYNSSEPSSTTEQGRIVATLTKGLERLTASFPWVTGQVLNEGSNGDGDTGIFKIKPLDPTPRLVVKDFTNDATIPSLDEMTKAGFPMSMFDENIVAPRNTIPGTSGEEKKDVMEIFLMQVTFIRGGLMLCFVGQHQVMDMTGQRYVIDLLDKACRGDEFTEEEVRVGNLVGKSITPLFGDEWELGAELDDQMVKSKSAAETETVSDEPPVSEWAFFNFSPQSLTALKSLAVKDLVSGFVSTDDVLTAFIYQSIARARLPRLDPSKTATLGRAVDCRKFLSLPATYPGICQNMIYHTNNIKDLTTLPLGTVASQLRSALNPKASTLAHDTKALATVLTRSKDKGITSPDASLDLEVDIMLSSWAKMDFWQLDFGLSLGKPVSVRRPRLITYESLLYLMPKDRDGGIAVAVCLREEDMGRLRDDGEVKEFGRYVG
jgi:hypothetical protein